MTPYRFFALTVAISFYVPIANAQTRYEVTELPALSAEGESRALSINDCGQVAGTVSLSSPGGARAVRFSRGALEDLGLPTGYIHTYGVAINRWGVVGANGQREPFGSLYGLLFMASGGSVDIAGLGGVETSVYDMNGLGIVVGSATISPERGGWGRAFKYNNGQTLELPLPSTAHEDSISEARGVNELGDIVGAVDVTLEDGRSAYQATLWGRDGAIVDLDAGGLESEFSIAYAVNNSLTAVGWAIDSEGSARAFRATSGSSSYIPGMHAAYDINEAGTIVGFGYLPVVGLRAMILENGIRHDLNDVLVNGTGWTLERAVSINNYGQIAGQGRFNGRARGFVLTPQGVTPTTRCNRTLMPALAARP